MSDNTPITGELRRKMDTLGWYDEDGNIVFTTGGEPASEMACLVINSKTFGELCDAIDAIHANLERENGRLRCGVADLKRLVDATRETDAWKLGYDEGFASADDWMADNEDAMAEHGWVRLPKDADGMPIHIGDVMELVGTDSLLREVVGVCTGGFFSWRDGRVVQCNAGLYNHHIPDTWESIIDCAEALSREWFNTDMSENEHAKKLDALVARCKALAGEDE